MKRIFATVLSLSLFVTFSSQAASPTILINEIMFHTPGTNKLEQWFELYNPAAKSVSLSGWKITKSVSFTFPANAAIAANGYLVVAADGPTFHANYPSVLNYVGGWTGSLGHHLE